VVTFAEKHIFCLTSFSTKFRFYDLYKTNSDSDEAIPQDVLLKNVQGVGALFCMLTDKIDEEVLENAGNI
jgi:hypothetical protein